MNKYYKIIDNDSNGNFPYKFFIETDKDDYPIKFIEIFLNETFNYATDSLENGTFLPPLKIHIEEYEDCKEITKEEFYDEWKIRVDKELP
ncbi:hypothetical protein [Flavobacterium columnare]|uniref:Uncharacterized protein n=1 Tax=Flavobacterium columnare TaxID=996 RepID=A0AA94EXB0_9FLAO|nr:hypothetical protein [Flavobacterium columnare]MCH4829567.1 hypothetical protein [Flavobacterium columnare]MCH4831436.1 hypothetical protein [Flavobacterium columnare]